MMEGTSPAVRASGRGLRVVLLTLGSRGDVEPYLGLGVALARAGHRVIVAAPAAFEPLTRRAGLEPFVVPPDPRLHPSDGEAPRWLQPSAAMGAFRLRRAALAAWGLSAMYSGYLEAGRGADVILFPAWLAPVARTIVEVVGCRAVPAYLAPIHPTRSFPSPFFNLASHTVWNRLSHSIALWLARAALGDGPDAWRLRIAGLPPVRIDFLPPEREICLYGFSRCLLPPPPDWPDGVVVTGPWWLDAPDEWRPGEALERLLDASTKIVFLGFGSMMDSRPEDLNAIVAEALRRLACRAILLAGPDGQLDLPPSPHWLTVQDVPFDWLFRRMDAIVHHGGAGTTAQAARAGKPSFAIPFFADQLFWGQRAHHAGAGPRPIPRRSLTVARLTSAIDQALGDPDCAQAAARLGAQVRAEDGASAAVRLIEAARACESRGE